jgi:tartronate-semialdehyde synthase
MPRMRTVDAAVAIMVKEGVDVVFGLPGAAINPFYSAMRADGSIRHVLARHVEGASHMAEGYTRTAVGNIGVCVGTSGPAGTDMITGLYSAQADSIPILAITGQAPVARLHKEDFQAVDIAGIEVGDQDGDDRARTGAGARRVPAGLPPDALGPARAGAARPAVRRADGRDRL